MERTTILYSKIGERFGKLVLLEVIKDGVFKARVRCDCGNEKIVIGTNLMSGKTQSCGCMWNKQGWRGLGKTHGLTKHPLYMVWADMKSRCNNGNHDCYKHYGGRGIVVCEDWNKDFVAFYTWANENGYQKGLQLDRKENDGNYEPNNCRFVTPVVNTNNRRNTIYVEHNGEKIALMDMARKYNIPHTTLWQRYKRNHSLIKT